MGASGVFGSPVDLPEGSWQNPVDLSESSQQNPFDLTEDDGGPVTDPNKGVCIGKLMGTQFTVWARVIGRNRVGFRADCTDENGQFVDDIALWPEFTIVADERIERWDVWRDGTDADIRARLRAMLLLLKIGTSITCLTKQVRCHLIYCIYIARLSATIILLRQSKHHSLICFNNCKSRALAACVFCIALCM